MFVQKHRLPDRKERYINAPGVMHNVVIVPVRATRCRYRPRAWVWLRLAWPGSAAQGKPRRRQAGQAVALRRPGKTRKVSPCFEKYCINRCRNDAWSIPGPISEQYWWWSSPATPRRSFNVGGISTYYISKSVIYKKTQFWYNVVLDRYDDCCQTI